jgi:hypothetical protein
VRHLASVARLHCVGRDQTLQNNGKPASGKWRVRLLISSRSRREQPFSTPILSLQLLGVF